MVNILVDEGYAYDVLAICKVKCIKNLLNCNENFNVINDSLKNQLLELHEEIIASIEYLDLVNANIETFNAVEQARYGTISAKEVDDLNMKRFICKKNLQLKFFPKSIILEQKS
jgi:hypothetical protein